MKFRNRYWQVQNRCAAEQVALLQRIEAGGVDVDIDRVSAVEPDPLLVEQSGPEAFLFDLDPSGTGLIVQIGITCQVARVSTAGCDVTLPFLHAPFELLEPHDMRDKYREYAFPGKPRHTRPFNEVINHRLGQMRRGDHIEGSLLAMTSTPIPAHWGMGGIDATVAVLVHLGKRCCTEVRLFVAAPRTRNQPFVAKALKSGLCRPVRGGVGGVALADSFDDGAPEGSQGRLGDPNASGDGKQEGSSGRLDD